MRLGRFIGAQAEKESGYVKGGLSRDLVCIKEDSLYFFMYYTLSILRNKLRLKRRSR
jgi:hypothetical protein